jgi:hypothetical protein
VAFSPIGPEAGDVYVTSYGSDTRVGLSIS